MSIGQRIAQKRKELGLSQEALGEELGVSRQAIYKWESDSAVPEVEKLVQLSRRFGVSVGWLLGVEDGQPEDAESDGELTEQQLKMVEEIVSRYLAAQEQPAPAKPKRRIWLRVLVAVALIAAVWSLFSRLEQLDDRYNSLQNSVNQVTSSVNGQIGSISNRVEEVLKAQNQLTADYGTERLEADYVEGTVRFRLYAVPKTYVPGMRAEFVAVSGGETVTLPVEEGEQQRFSAELTCPLSDQITLSVVFLRPDGTRETQLLEDYWNLVSESYPDVHVDAFAFFGKELPEGKLTLTPTECFFLVDSNPASSGAAQVKSLRAGVFRDQKLVAWGEPCGQPESYVGRWEGSFFQLPELSLSLKAGDTLQVAALVTDTYGRQFMAMDVPFVVQEGEDGDPLYLTYPADGTYDSDVSAWEFD